MSKGSRIQSPWWDTYSPPNNLNHLKSPILSVLMGILLVTSHPLQIPYLEKRWYSRDIEIRNQCQEFPRSLSSLFSLVSYCTSVLFFFPVRDRKVFLCFAVLGWNMAERAVVQPPSPHSHREGTKLIELNLAWTPGSITTVWRTPMGEGITPWITGSYRTTRCQRTKGPWRTTRWVSSFDRWCVWA